MNINPNVSVFVNAPGFPIRFYKKFLIRMGGEYVLDYGTDELNIINYPKFRYYDFMVSNKPDEIMITFNNKVIVIFKYKQSDVDYLKKMLYAMDKVTTLVFDLKSFFIEIENDCVNEFEYIEEGNNNVEY